MKLESASGYGAWEIFKSHGDRHYQRAAGMRSNAVLTGAGHVNQETVRRITASASNRRVER